MSTFRPQKRRDAWFRDVDGVVSTTKRSEEIVSETIDWTNLLDSGETIASASWESKGVTISGEANTTTTTTATITGTGEAIIEIVTSDSRTLQQRLRWTGIDSDSEDYV